MSSGPLTLLVWGLSLNAHNRHNPSPYFVAEIVIQSIWKSSPGCWEVNVRRLGDEKG